MASASDIPLLTPLEKAGPKGFVRYLFPFELANDYEIDEIFAILTASLEATKKRLPLLACEAVPDTESKQGGVLKLQHGDFGDIKLKDLTAPGAFPMTYQELKSKHFPVSAFDAEIMCRRPVWPSLGDRLPITEVQANFIPGGLILNWCILHMIGDGKTFQKILEVWAEECRKVQGIKITFPLELPNKLFDKTRLAHSSGQNKGRLEDHPELTLLPFVPTGAPPKMMSPSHRAEIFYFSPASLAELKRDASPVNATRPPEDIKWISTNDALSALLWRTVMDVQYPLNDLEGDPQSLFNIAIDGRSRASPPYPADMFGCFLEYVATTMPIRTMLTQTSLADIAIEVRRAIAKADENYTDDIITLLEQIPNYDQIVGTAFLDVPGHNCVQTSWAGFNLYDIDWGHKLGGAIQAIRCPSVGVINGCQVIFPALLESMGGGLEVLIGVEESSLSRLEQNALWNKYASKRA